MDHPWQCYYTAEDIKEVVLFVWRHSSTDGGKHCYSLHTSFCFHSVVCFELELPSPSLDWTCLLCTSQALYKSFLWLWFGSGPFFFSFTLFTKSIIFFLLFHLGMFMKASFSFFTQSSFLLETSGDWFTCITSKLTYNLANVPYTCIYSEIGW